MSIQYLASSNASTSANYVQVPQFQVMTVASSTQSETKTINSNKKSGKNTKKNADSQPDSSDEHSQHIQLVTMDQNVMLDNNQYIIQMPQGQIGAQYQVVSNGNMAPMQLVNLSDGTAFVPAASFNGQPTILQTNDGQQIQFVLSTDGIYSQENPPPITSNEENANKASEDSPCYVNPKQYARIFQRRGARARLEMEGRISKTRRLYLHESRHKHALNRVRGGGGKFNSNPNGTSEDGISTCSSPTSSIGRANNSFSPKSVKTEAPSDGPPSKRPAPQESSSME